MNERGRHLNYISESDQVLDIDELIKSAFNNNNPWVRRRKVEYTAVQEVLSLAEKILPCLGSELNKLHLTNNKVQFYNIILGPWLLQFLSVFYDRYQLSKEVAEENDFQAVDNNFNIVPIDTFHALKISETKRFNNQIITDISKAKGCNIDKAIEVNALRASVRGDFDRDYSNKTKSQIKNKIINRFTSFTKRKGAVVISLSAMPLKLQVALFLRNREVRPIYPFQCELEQSEVIVSSEVRADIKLNFDASSEFEKVVQILLPYYIPTSFVECFETLSEKAKGYGSYPRAIILSTEMYSRYEAFMIWVARSEAAGTKICTVQHGGDYGLHRRCETVFTEINPYHKFYSWGWSWGQFKTSASAIIKPMPAPHLMSQSKFKYKKVETQRLVYVTTARRKYTRRFMGTVAHVYNNDRYVENQLQFYRNLSTVAQKNLEVRLYKNDYSGFARKMWLAENPSINFDREPSFSLSIANSNCVLIDHLSTTWLEAINLDRPTIIFIDPSDYDFTDEVKDIISELQRACILHFTPVSAAAHLSEVHSSTNSWWRSKAVQSALEEIKSSMISMPHYPVMAWHNELKSL